MQIEDNSSLKNLQGINNLETGVENGEIKENEMLHELRGLNKLKTINGYFRLVGNPNLYKINSLFVSNTDTATAVNVTVNYYDSSSVSAATTSGSIANSITVPAKSNLVILDKSTALYLEENDAIQIMASLANSINVLVSYEIIA